MEDGRGVGGGRKIGHGRPRTTAVQAERDQSYRSCRLEFFSTTIVVLSAILQWEISEGLRADKG